MQQVASPLFDAGEQPSLVLPPPSASSSDARTPPRLTKTASFTSARTPSTSPTRSSAFFPFTRSTHSTSSESLASQYSASNEQKSHARTKSGAVGKLASLFEGGTSEPVNITLVPSPNKDRRDPFYQLDKTRDPPMHTQDNLTQRPSKRPNMSPTASNTSVFSFFRRSTIVQHAKSCDDDLSTLDITQALFPNGSVEEVTPEAFKALRQNAEALLTRFQQSHTEHVKAIRSSTYERTAQADEIEALQTRNEHLKMQLTNMAELAVVQEKSIGGLKVELNKHQQSIRMITEDEPNPSLEWRRKRISHGSCSDESYAESDISSAVSVFSEAESIRNCSPATSVATSPVLRSARLCSPTLKSSPVLHAHTTPVLVPDCSNCHGVPAAEAWDVIGIMKMESVALKQRVAELEQAQDAALDFLDALNI